MFCLVLLARANAQNTEIWPEGMSFVGLEQGQWQLYFVPPDASASRIVSTVSEPRTFTYHPHTDKIAYIGTGGNLHEITPNNTAERVLLHADSQRTFTQPAYDAKGIRLFMVMLKNRESVETDIVVLEESRLRPVVTQRSAQLEPYFHTPNLLYYTNLICPVGCGRIIQEIWRMDLASGVASQVTLLNAMTRQPVVSRDGRWLYFASDKASHFHIWRMELATNQYEQLTSGVVTDTSPALDRDGQVYFIRHSPDGTQLMRWQADGDIRPLRLPDGVEDLRDLEIHP